MAYSFASKLIDLRNKKIITAGEVEELIGQLGKYELEIRNKAIDEFAERLKAESFSGYVTLEDYCEDTVECVSVEDIDEIAEQMKGGAE